MAKLTIMKGEEFKLTVKEKINKDDIFIDQYRSALEMVDEIIEASKRESKIESDLKWKNSEYENNIIAFCGNRGDGKSSAMLTLVNAIYNYSRGKEIGESSIFEGYSNIQNTYFAEPIIIDPTLFDDVHNVLDIVLARLYRNFDEKYRQDNQSIDIKQREKLLDQFQKVYRYLSLINNQAQLLDDEYDYEGNIGKLSKLGESTNLKDALVELIDQYLIFMEKYKTDRNGKGERQLIIAIDDLDLCSANAYKMAEQIRKYLIIPHLTIVMAVRIEQLELCVEEQNCRNFENILKWNKQESGQIDDEIKSMAERYIAKLIPKARRIYLPKVQEFGDVEIVYKEYTKEGEEGEIIWSSSEKGKSGSNGKKRTFAQNVLDLIYEKIGMRFFIEKQGNCFLLPSNLRDMVNWIVIFADMESPQETNFDEDNLIYYKNIAIFKQIFEKQWINSNLSLNMEMKIREISDVDVYYMNMNAWSVLNRAYNEFSKDNQAVSAPYFAGGQNISSLQNPSFYSEREDKFSLIVEWLRIFTQNVYDIDKRRYAYTVRVLYAIRISQLLRSKQRDDFWKLSCGYIWGGWFVNIIAGVRAGLTYMDRSRFYIRTWEAYNIVMDELFQGGEKLSPREPDGAIIISKIPSGEEKARYIKSWIMLGLFSNTYGIDSYQRMYLSTAPIVYENYKLQDFIHISVENYIIGLCDLRGLYDKINMNLLKVDRTEFNAIADEIEELNKDNIVCAREIISNMDVLLDIKEYFNDNKRNHSSAKDEKNTNCVVIDKFFNNISNYMTGHSMKGGNAKLQNFRLGEEEEIYVSSLYARLIEVAAIYYEEQQNEVNKAGKLTQEYRKRLIELPEIWNDEMRYVAAYVRNATAKQVKKYLDSLAENIQRYIGIKKEIPKNLDVERICKLYSDVLSLYLIDENILVTEEMRNEYKEIAKINNALNV